MRNTFIFLIVCLMPNMASGQLPWKSLGQKNNDYVLHDIACLNNGSYLAVGERTGPQVFAHPWIPFSMSHALPAVGCWSSVKRAVCYGARMRA
ncbi:MAG: hypothetical protein IH600_01545 [Bacteroidetes bacterium]|nr:hypothetical protein [Bacteroidota bacterium]